jgi:hypothetical protein
MTPEAKVKKKIKEILDYYNAWYFCPAQNGYGRAGIPDFVGCYKGKFFAVEAKAAYNKTTALQDRELKAIADAGGGSFIIREDTLDYLHDWFRSADYANSNYRL